MMTIRNNDFTDVVLNRHSVRYFDTEAKISREELTEMIQQTILAPSACNLQPWKFVIIDTEEGKEKLRSFFLQFNLPQVDTAAAIVFIFGDTNAYKSYRDVWNKAAEEGRISPEKRDEVLRTFLPLYEAASYEGLVTDAKIGGSLAAMQLMLVARAHGYDTNAIQGYNAKVAAEILGLDPVRYVPTMAIAIGKEDVLKNKDTVKTTRYSVDDVTTFL
ncbi:nitroreductase family protein [Streptococcus caprae]|uniref:Nitroreductase family protein n=1 Tax=Streptococcus caprae TaxID=1640501 RepID=A0ABV8CSZ3_9STRE